MYEFISKLAGWTGAVSKKTVNILEVVCFILITIIFVFTLAAGILRYILPSLAGWTGVEIPTVTCMWATSIGIPLAVYYGDHLRIGILSRLIKGKFKDVYNLIISLISFGFYYLLIRLTWSFVDNNRFATSPMMNIPLIYIYASILIGLSLSMFFLISTFIYELQIVFQWQNSITKPQKNTNQNEVTKEKC